MTEGNRPVSTRNSDLKKPAKIDEEEVNIYNKIEEGESAINDPYYKGDIEGEGSRTSQ